MKKNIWRKHPINRSTIHLPKMARKLHRICQTIRKKLIKNYQTTWKLFAKIKKGKMMIIT